MRLFEPFDLAGLQPPNRIVMAPMTRSRAINTVPDDLTALYYRQRAGAGLIVTEGSQISVEGRGYLFAPGIHSAEQVAGWRRVTEAVHEAGGRIFIQLGHVGRVSHRSLQHKRESPVSSVSRTAAGATAYAYDPSGAPAAVPVSRPRSLTTFEVARVKNDFLRAAESAVAAGFDGVELHGANGYLMEQFINGALNTRNDVYGGFRIANRLRFVLETIDEVSAAIGPSMTGIRLSPFGRLNSMAPFSDEEETWLALACELSSRRLAYVHLNDQWTLGHPNMTRDFRARFRKVYSGTLMMAGGFGKASAENALALGLADLIAFGSPFIANPDLVERLWRGYPLARVDHTTLYEGGPKGYTDYPAYQGTSPDLSATQLAS
ncbi:NADH:flavin oxidoreductase [Caballeronia arationis]|jgi:2,4-dienoyl-CoA reductase-like NADH-dependent reductase (Old Yellow Enzyme family)|uniref:2,4-dienoyl-CoA reductase n=1 Tax=Caballeronia arationis TaxID=1777142 RepID=A0A7Z7IF30_9BURK|nr:alkene reductase [Caballeronia arationis]SAL03052.1 NADH:flavin oxidoreductase [Caballeronia arationis]SOE91419.1 2,4-dienoyl-CoA reductase [Caballeronia arationis]